MEETLKSLLIAPKILMKRSNSIWDSLLATEEETKLLAGSILTTKAIRLQTEYMGIRVTLYGFPWTSLRTGWRSFYQVQINHGCLIVTEDFVLQETMTRKSFLDVPD